VRGVYCLFTTFNTIVGVKEPNYGDVCLSLCMLVFKENCVFNKWDVIYLLLMIEFVDDVVVLMIGTFGKSLNYKGDSAQNFIFFILFTSLLNFKWS